MMHSGTPMSIVLAKKVQIVPLSRRGPFHTLGVAAFKLTKQNQLAADYLKNVRVEHGKRVRGKELDRVEFATLLAQALEVGLSPQMYRTYENGTRAVPAAVMIAASQVSGVPMVVDEQQGELILDWLERKWEERASVRGVPDGSSLAKRHPRC